VPNGSNCTNSHTNSHTNFHNFLGKIPGPLGASTLSIFTKRKRLSLVQHYRVPFSSPCPLFAPTLSPYIRNPGAAHKVNARRCETAHMTGVCGEQRMRRLDERRCTTTVRALVDASRTPGNVCHYQKQTQ